MTAKVATLVGVVWLALHGKTLCRGAISEQGWLATSEEVGGRHSPLGLRRVGNPPLHCCTGVFGMHSETPATVHFRICVLSGAFPPSDTPAAYEVRRPDSQVT